MNMKFVVIAALSGWIALTQPVLAQQTERVPALREKVYGRVMIHKPLGGFSGQASDIDIHAQEILKTRDRLNTILKNHTGQNIKTIQKDTDRDYFMSASESAKYGIIDKVLTKR